MAPPRYQFRRPCLTCGQLSQQSYCEQHTPKRPRGPDSQRRRGKKGHLYGGTYAKRAKQVRMNAEICHICNKGPLGGDPWEADHLNPELGSQSILLPAHRSCNRKRGNKPINPTPHTHKPTPPTGNNQGWDKSS